MIYLDPLRLKWGHLATGTHFTAYDYTIGQLVQSYTVQPGRALDVPEEFTLALMFDASATVGSNHHLAVSLVQLGGDTPLGSVRDYPLNFDNIVEGPPTGLQSRHWFFVWDWC